MRAGKVDVHAHYLPPFYQDALKARGHANPDGMPAVPNWSPEAHLALMDKLNISKSILSISSPGTHLQPGQNEDARQLARDVNRYASDLQKQHPTRFGFFASLPMPDVEGCLAEIPRAIEEGCTGFVFETNSHGHYLGDRDLDAVFDELNRRHALIFIHPTTPMCPCQPGGEGGERGPTRAAPFAGRLPQPMLEFFFDTARIVTNLFMSGTIKRCPHLRIILPHLGGAFPPLLSRWTAFSALVPGPWVTADEAEIKALIARQIWFDLAGVSVPGQLKGLMATVDVTPDRILYGSDYPFTNAGGVELLLGRMERGLGDMFDEEEREDMYRRNAEKLLALGPPRMKGDMNGHASGHTNGQSHGAAKGHAKGHTNGHTNGAHA